MNLEILKPEVQKYIQENLNTDVNKIALTKSPFKSVTSKELSIQINSKKKAEKKLPTWFNSKNIYFPESLSIEQTSSEKTARYKSKLAIGETLIDLTAGFGVDSFYFSKVIKKVTSCEINSELAEITKHNFTTLGAKNIQILNTDGVSFLESTSVKFDTIYLDPARRSGSAKVFMLKDCTPNIVADLDFLLTKTQRIMLKTAPLLDLKAGLKELKNVREIHIVSTKNECKELIWVIESKTPVDTKIICTTINHSQKEFSFILGTENLAIEFLNKTPSNYLYEPDVALLKSGAFNLIAKEYKLEKLENQSQLYHSEEINEDFAGRIFKVETIFTLQDFKKEKNISGNIIVRNFPEKPEILAKKHKIKQNNHQFYIFTKTQKDGYIVIKAIILQHY
ncbi:MAG: class I SAM-dependent methyltransferase [Sphingobacteriaceae bacterium]|nr:class I SAM-dependent methyltransferase [Sphingobacteriaceae bacterium]